MKIQNKTGWQHTTKTVDGRPGAVFPALDGLHSTQVVKVQIRLTADLHRLWTDCLLRCVADDLHVLFQHTRRVRACFH